MASRSSCRARSSRLIPGTRRAAARSRPTTVAEAIDRLDDADARAPQPARRQRARRSAEHINVFVDGDPASLDTPLGPASDDPRDPGGVGRLSRRRRASGVEPGAGQPTAASAVANGSNVSVRSATESAPSRTWSCAVGRVAEHRPPAVVGQALERRDGRGHGRSRVLEGQAREARPASGDPASSAGDARGQPRRERPRDPNRREARRSTSPPAGPAGATAATIAAHGLGGRPPRVAGRLLERQRHARRTAPGGWRPRRPRAPPAAARRRATAASPRRGSDRRTARCRGRSRPTAPGARAPGRRASPGRTARRGRGPAPRRAGRPTATR